MINHLVKQVSEGDILAIPPLLDELEEGLAKHELLRMVGNLHNGIKRQELRSLHGPADSLDWNVYFRKSKAWEYFKKDFDSLFWEQLDGRPLVTIISELAGRCDGKALMDKATQQAMDEARAAWYSDPANNMGYGDEDPTDDSMMASPEGE